MAKASTWCGMASPAAGEAPPPIATTATSPPSWATGTDGTECHARGDRAGHAAPAGQGRPLVGMCNNETRRAAIMAAVAVGLGVAVSGCAGLPRPEDGAGGRVSARPSQEHETQGPETPAYASELSRVCEDGLGFAGLPAYRRSDGKVHPAVLMDRSETSWTFDSPLDNAFPRGWILGYDDDVKTAQLVVCYERTGASPAGKICPMQDSKTKKPLNVTMYDTTYRLRVLEARTGRSLYKYNGKAASTTCPSLTFTLKGEDRDKHFTEARPADYRKLIARFIAA